jgi:hypothetical protein
MKNNTPTDNNTAEKYNVNRILTIFVVVFVALALVLGIVLGAVAISKRNRAAVVYESTLMGKEEAAFFVGYYKMRYMTALTRSGVSGVEDTQSFWNRTDPATSKTYGELLSEGARDYIRQVTVANYLYDRATKLTKNDKEKISEACESLVDFRAGGNREEFESLISDYGFSYDGLCRAAGMLYKANALGTVLYGEGGENIASYPEYADGYLAKYTHVKLLIIRTEETFVVDENGDKVADENGEYKLAPLSAEAKAKREALISEIRGYIDAIGTDKAQMGATMFDTYIEAHDEEDENMRADGYYFKDGSYYTSEFSRVYSDKIINKAYEMSENTFGEVELNCGVCFIYKYQPTAKAYLNSPSEDCFIDFYSLAANDLLSENIEKYTKDVSFTEKFGDIDPIMLPYNYDFIPKF